mmetsp:Transcript_20702/g.46839  ORF Transcript_20702/g.46839 Transcript_20702/m.46839 type:complete len:1147 (-) Transcript_20702:194-3634(-)
MSNQQQQQQQAQPAPGSSQAAAAAAAQTEGPPASAPAQPRFEDLTIDDDLPLLPRLQRYVRSSIALQRLVHVRMLGEVALEVGRQLTATELVPLLPPLVRDGESIIRQRVCSELKVLSLVLMGMTGGPAAAGGAGGRGATAATAATTATITTLPQIPRPDRSSKYYKVMTHHLFPHLYALTSDPDNEVRRAASENIVKLALRIDAEDVISCALSIPLRLVKEGQRRATKGATKGGGKDGKDPSDADAAGGSDGVNPATPAEDLLVTASNLLADLASFLPPTRLSPEVCSRYLSPTILALSEDPNFRVRRAAVQALPRMLGSATLDDVKRRLLPRFVALSGDEMYRVRKASGECLVDMSRALAVLPWRLRFGDVWVGPGDFDGRENGPVDVRNRAFYRQRTPDQLRELEATVAECHDIRRRALCVISKKLLEDGNKFVRYGMMQFLGPLIASFYNLDRGSMVGSMNGLLHRGIDGDPRRATLGVGAESVGIAKGSAVSSSRPANSDRGLPRPVDRVEDLTSYNHSLLGLETILHGESDLVRAVLPHGGLGSSADRDPFGTMGGQYFPHACGMVGRSSALDDDDTDSFLLGANLKRHNTRATPAAASEAGAGGDARSQLPKFVLEGRSDALALTRIVWHRAGLVPSSPSDRDRGQSHRGPPSSPLSAGRPDPDDLALVGSTLLPPFIAMASCSTGEETTDAEMRVYCAYSLPAVLLLFGGHDWEANGLKGCFMDLIGNPADGDEEEGNAGGANQPPLPVKRCLASSVHAVAHLLGPSAVSSDSTFLLSFERAFLRDPDEAIRLNVLKNLASFLASLPPGDGPGGRDVYLPLLSGVIMGEDVLGAARKRSASNPGVLNWRQRDAVARVLPDVLVLFGPDLAREYLWPVLKALLTDSVSAVREDAAWSVPVLLRRYHGPDGGHSTTSRWTSEVVEWLRETFLGDGDQQHQSRGGSKRSASSRRFKRQGVSSEGAFSRRQGYCKILAAVSLAMRIGEGEEGGDYYGGGEYDAPPPPGVPGVPADPFGRLTPGERSHLASALVDDLLPPALEMAADPVANVRLTLTKCLGALPPDVRAAAGVDGVLGTLAEELRTWDVGDMPLGGASGAVGILGPSAVATGAVPGAVADPPPAGVGVAQQGGVVMTSTMSAC